MHRILAEHVADCCQYALAPVSSSFAGDGLSATIGIVNERHKRPANSACTKVAAAVTLATAP
jgi:hypothetical protein